VRLDKRNNLHVIPSRKIGGTKDNPRSIVKRTAAGDTNGIRGTIKDTVRHSHEPIKHHLGRDGEIGGAFFFFQYSNIFTVPKGGNGGTLGAADIESEKKHNNL
jgi:hypothetical protein